MPDDPTPSEPLITSTVQVIGLITIRTYSDGAIQRNVWNTGILAQEYADSVALQEGV